MMTPPLGDLVVGVLLATWFAMTLVAQWMPQPSQMLRRVDPLRLFRRFEVFAPAPELLTIRAQLGVLMPDGQWRRESFLRYPSPTWRRTFWNPRHAAETALARDCLTVTRAATTQPGASLLLRRLEAVARARAGADAAGRTVRLDVELNLDERDGSRTRVLDASFVFPTAD